MEGLMGGGARGKGEGGPSQRFVLGCTGKKKCMTIFTRYSITSKETVQRWNIGNFKIKEYRIKRWRYLLHSRSDR